MTDQIAKRHIHAGKPAYNIDFVTPYGFNLD
jgi:hypothetical protein